VAVLMTNASLGVRRRQDAARDAHGERLPAPWGPVNGPHPGRTNETADATWNLGLDPVLWPVRQGDLVIDAAGGSWLVDTADLIRNNLDPSVDWIRVTGRHRTAAGTEPGGAWFVARYESYVDPAPDTGDTTITQTAAGMWTGYGPPPTDPFGAAPGDEYLDLLSGTVYRLDAG
jgi:hypothetical protein